MGRAEVLVACCTDSVSPPAGFSAVSHVKGVSVAYTVQPYPIPTPLLPPSPLASLSAHAKTGSVVRQSPKLIPDAVLESRVSDVSQASRSQPGRSVRADFGDCSIGDSKSLLLSITNESPIAASVSLWLDTFQADLPSAAAVAAAALTQPYAMASSGLVFPRSPTGQRSHLSQLSSADGMSAYRGQSPAPTLTLGFTAGAGGAQSMTPTLRLGPTAGSAGSIKGLKHSARRAGFRTGTEHGNKQSLVSPSSCCTLNLRLGLGPKPETPLKFMHLGLLPEHSCKYGIVLLVMLKRKGS